MIVAGGVVLLLVLLLWTAAFRGWGSDNASGRIKGSEQWLSNARSRCVVTNQQIASLRPASAETSPQSRAETLRTANGYLADMLTDISSTSSVDERDLPAVTLWLQDWRAFLASRDAYADLLASGADKQFTEPVVEGKPASIGITSFAMLNRISVCAAPTDL
jgi:hypothetical protein